MRAAVLSAFIPFTSGFEGRVPWMYLDVKGLVTTAIGNKIDPITDAVDMPFEHADGRPATVDEIAHEWTIVHGHQEMAPLGGSAFQHVTFLRLSDRAIDAIVNARLAHNDVYLSHRFSGYESWPADAQLAVLSMSWAMGPAFRYPRCVAALAASDFDGAADECWIGPKLYGAQGNLIPDPKNRGVHPRNLANVQMLRNAARVRDRGWDPAELYYPMCLERDPAAV